MICKVSDRWQNGRTEFQIRSPISLSRAFSTTSHPKKKANLWSFDNFMFQYDLSGLFNHELPYSLIKKEDTS